MVWQGLPARNPGLQQGLPAHNPGLQLSPVFAVKVNHKHDQVNPGPTQTGGQREGHGQVAGTQTNHGTEDTETSLTGAGSLACTEEQVARTSLLSPASPVGGARPGQNTPDASAHQGVLGSVQ